MSYAWKITLNSEDISEKVSGFSITCSMESFCREMTLDISDPDLYAELDFSQISEAPEIEIFTKTAASWISQGTFFIERPALASTVRSDLMQGVWGRSRTALLAEPFAPKVSKTWEERTTFFAICQEMCDLAGFAWDESYSDISDFGIYPYTYEADGLYPIDVISELAELAGAVVTTDRAGHLCIKQIDYSPSSADVTITDEDIGEINESLEWPEFGNRLRITPTGALASYSVVMTIPDPCLPADGSSKTKLLVQVKDPDGEPVDGAVVSWETDSDTATLDYATSNTQEVLIRGEQRRASNFYTVATAFEPSAVDGIWAYSDVAKSVNLIDGGYEINGKTITLTDPLTYCDQLLVIDYRAQGMAVNYLTAGNVAEDVTVTADVEGQQDRKTVYIDNPCQCPPTIRLTASPTSITINSVSKLLVYVEESGPVTAGRIVFMSESGAVKRGVLDWTSARIGQVSVINEKSVAKNEVAGVTQCDLSMFPASVSSVYAADDDGNPTGEDLYGSNAGKVIDLSEYVATGTDLLVSYVAQGAAINLFAGNSLGLARITAYILTTSEAGAEASATIHIEDKSQITDDYPADWNPGDDDGGYGGPGGEDGDGVDDGGDGEGSGDDTGSNDWEDDPPSDLCRHSDGTLKKCGAGEKCCTDGSTFGCFPEDDCEDPPHDPCFPESVSDNPTGANLAGRFADGLDNGCTCEELCRNEFDVLDTNQGYDNGSGRTVSQIAAQDHAPGSPGFWEKYNELKNEAISECVAQCTECEGLEDLAWSEDNPETIAPESSASVSVTGDKAPYIWSVVGTGFWFDAEHTLTVIESGGGVILYTDEDACGAATINVSGACEGVVEGVVKCTVGRWSDWTYTCGSWSTGTYANSCCNLVTDKTWYQAWCRYQAGCVCGGANQECLPIEYGGINCATLGGVFMQCCHWPDGDPDRGTFCERYATWECDQ